MSEKNCMKCKVYKFKESLCEPSFCETFWGEGNEDDFLAAVIYDGRWIPVTERLPEEDNTAVLPYYDEHPSAFVLVTVEGCTYPQRKKKVQIGRYSYQEGKWKISSAQLGHVIAWMPLPKPYHETRKEE